MVAKTTKASKSTKKNKVQEQDNTAPVEVATVESVVEETKTVDLDFVIPIAHIKKYVSKYRMNKVINDNIDITRECSEHEKKPKLEDNLTSEVMDMINNYYINASTKSKKDMENMDQYQKALHALSIFKYKFSGNAFVVITYVINLIAREIIMHSLEQTIVDKKKSLTPVRIPWNTLKSQMMGGLYMNTSTVQSIISSKETSTDTEESSTENIEETVESTEEVQNESASTEEEEDTTSIEAKLKKYNLKHFLHKMSKLIITSDKRFAGFKINSSFTEECNKILIDVIERYIHIITNLLDIATNKTISDKIFLVATKIMVEDNIYVVESHKTTLYSLISSKIEEMKKMVKTKKTDKK